MTDLEKPVHRPGRALLVKLVITEIYQLKID
jgi:hypothetical protein